MEREKILAILLVISLSANVYLFLGDPFSLENSIGESIGPILFPAAGASSNSTLDREGEIATWTGEPGPEVTLSPVPVERSDLIPEPTPEQTAEPTLEPTLEPTPEATQEPPPGTVSWVNYSSTKYPFSLQYPSHWNISETATGSPRGALRLTPPSEKDCPRGDSQCYLYMASIVIEVDPNPGTPNPEDYFTLAIAAIESKYAITSTSKSAPTYLSGSRAYQIEFFTRDKRGNPDLSYMQYYGLFDGKAYIISYTGPYSSQENVYAKNKADAHRIIDSFVVERTYKTVS